MAGRLVWMQHQPAAPYHPKLIGGKVSFPSLDGMLSNDRAKRNSGGSKS